MIANIRQKWEVPLQEVASAADWYLALHSSCFTFELNYIRVALHSSCFTFEYQSRVYGLGFRYQILISGIGLVSDTN